VTCISYAFCMLPCTCVPFCHHPGGTQSPHSFHQVQRKTRLSIGFSVGILTLTTTPSRRHHKRLPSPKCVPDSLTLTDTTPHTRTRHQPRVCCERCFTHSHSHHNQKAVWSGDHVPKLTSTTPHTRTCHKCAVKAVILTLISIITYRQCRVETMFPEFSGPVVRGRFSLQRFSFEECKARHAELTQVCYV
jgi:hypothetical protein